MRYTILDSMCESVTGKGSQWSAGATVSVLLDTDHQQAFLLNSKQSTPISSLNINLLEEVDNMNYCKVITRENPSGPESDYFTDAIFAGVYISPDNEYKIFARISRKDAAGVDIRVHHNGSYKDLRADFATSMIPSANWYSCYSSRIGGIYIVPIENKPDEFFVRVMAQSTYSYVASEGGTSATAYSYANHNIVIDTNSVISNFGKSYYGATSQGIDDQIITNPRLVSCYWNETYQGYYLRSVASAVTGYAGLLYYVKPGVFDIGLYGSNYTTPNTDLYNISAAAWPVCSGTYSVTQSNNLVKRVLCFSKFLSDTEILTYQFEFYHNLCYLYVYDVSLTNYSSASSTQRNYGGGTMKNFAMWASVNYDSYWGYPYLYQIWGEDNSLEFYVATYLHNATSGGMRKVQLVKCSVTPDFTTFTESGNFEILETLYESKTMDQYSAEASNVYAGYRILGFLNGDRSKPIVFTDNQAVRRKFPITHYVGSSGELYEMVNYFNLTTTSPTYDTSYNRKSKDAFLGYMWLDLDNNRVVQITKDRLYYEGEPGLMEHKGTGTWTCPENGIYKIILVGGGAAGSSTGGGGSGHMKIAAKAYKKGDEIPYVIGAGEATFNSTDLGDNPSRTTWFDDEWAQPGIGNLGGANGYPASGGGGGGGYNLVDFGGNGQLIETVPRKNGGQGSMPAQGYGAGGAAGQPGADGCIVIIK